MGSEKVEGMERGRGDKGGRQIAMGGKEGKGIQRYKGKAKR